MDYLRVRDLLLEDETLAEHKLAVSNSVGACILGRIGSYCSRLDRRIAKDVSELLKRPLEMMEADLAVTGKSVQGELAAIKAGTFVQHAQMAGMFPDEGRILPMLQKRPAQPRILVPGTGAMN
jgi:hypothetical protein